MQKMQVSPFIVFVHIEKAAGITIHKILHEHFAGYISLNPSIRFGEFVNDKQLSRIINTYPIKVQGVGGHRLGSFMQYERITYATPFYFTFLREPCRRLLSHYNWHVVKKNSKLSLDEFLDDFDTVSKDQAIAVMEIASKLLSSAKISELYASVA